MPQQTSGSPFAALTWRSRACLERLKAHTPQPVALSQYPVSKLAAVLILIYEKDSSLRTALPGGKLDPDDVDLSAAAFREANEEVGLPLNCPHVHVLCHLRPFLSLYKLLVTPVVAVLTELSVLDGLRPSHDEVDRIFDHPLEAFLQPSLARQEPLSAMGEENWPYTTELYSTSDNPSYIGIYRMHRFRSRYTPIKGLTADILITTAEVAYDREPCYERRGPGQLEPLVVISQIIKEHEEPQVATLTKQNVSDGQSDVEIRLHALE